MDDGFFRFKPQSKQISMILHDHVIRMVDLSHWTIEIRSYHERFFLKELFVIEK
ncbi:hypothetical protein [Guptibacillus hwajinpoensis]|uniref:hypothetical protein n=1 Tax=Guptibacillus hwajinpoensis TaxID=208199 RepID=UPI00373568F1